MVLILSDFLYLNKISKEYFGELFKDIKNDLELQKAADLNMISENNKTKGWSIDSTINQSMVANMNLSFS